LRAFIYIQEKKNSEVCSRRYALLLAGKSALPPRGGEEKKNWKIGNWKMKEQKKKKKKKKKKTDLEQSDAEKVLVHEPRKLEPQVERQKCRQGVLVVPDRIVAVGRVGRASNDSPFTRAAHLFWHLLWRKRKKKGLEKFRQLCFELKKKRKKGARGGTVAHPL
jgi:hypothetical protein